MGLFEEDLSFFFVGVQHSRRSTIYFGAMPFIALHIRSSILYAIHCLIGRQGNWQSTGVIHVCSELWVLDTRWVAQFWTYCSLPRTDHGNPYRSALQGHLPVLSVLGVGHLQIWNARGPGIWQPRGHSQAFDTHAVSYQNITTQRVLLEKKQIGSSVKDRTKLKKVVKACSRFYTCISSLLIKPKLHSEIGAIDVNRRFLVIEWNFCWYYYLKNILSYL